MENTGLYHLKQSIEAQIKRLDKDRRMLQKQIRILDTSLRTQQTQTTIEEGYTLFIELPPEVQNRILEDIIWAKNCRDWQYYAKGRVHGIKELFDFKLSLRDYKHLIQEGIQEPTIKITEAK